MSALSIESLYPCITINDCVVVKSAKELDKIITQEAIEAINSAIGWSHYDSLINYHLGDSRYETIFALLDDRIVGYAQFSADYLTFLAVDPEQRKNRIGATLMSNVFKYSESSSLSLDYRYIEPFSTHKFYEKILEESGYRSIKKINGNYLNGDPKMMLTIFLKKCYD